MSGFEALRFLDSWDEAAELCGDYFKALQKLTDEAYDNVIKTYPNIDPKDLGSEVHNRVARQVNGIGDPNFRAETSFIIRRNRKSADETSSDQASTNEKYEEVSRRGIKGSKRFDTRLKKPEERLACVGDIKTGDEGLAESYVDEIVKRIGNNPDYDDIDRLIIAEVRPTAVRMRMRAQMSPGR